MAVEIEVDPHHSPESNGEVAPQVQAPEIEAAAAALGWTPEQAAQFVCAIFNIGTVLYGPDWTAHPSEVAGWDYYCAQVLDQVLPRGQGGAVEMGVGLVMIGNGLMMMGMRRWPLIKRGPRPIWVKEPLTEPEGTPAPQAPAPQAAPSPPEPPRAKEGPYVLPGVAREVPENRAQPWQTL